MNTRKYFHYIMKIWGYCDKLEHIIPTTNEKPIYLPHRTIPPQLQGEVRKCLDKWLKQGIIQHSTSPYASQVVLVHKKSGDVMICVDFYHLNGVTVQDAFPLPRIDEALAAVQGNKPSIPQFIIGQILFGQKSTMKHLNY